MFIQKLKPHYDKLLHVSITFSGVIFLSKWMPIIIAVVLIAIAQVTKTWLNYRCDKSYRPVGDWLANLTGYLLIAVYMAE